VISDTQEVRVKYKEINTLARIVVEYSTNVQPGDRVVINGAPAARPLLLALYKQALARGAFPWLAIHDRHSLRHLLDTGSPEQVSHIFPWEQATADHMDVVINVWGGENTRLLSGVDKERYGNYIKAHHPLRKRIKQEKVRWCVLAWPCSFVAQEADMPYRDYERLVFQSCFADQAEPIAAWQAFSKKQQAIVDALQVYEDFQLAGANMDLTFSTKDRYWVSCDGKVNMPDGEIYTAPYEPSVNGWIRFDLPALYQGELVLDAYLEFSEGACTQARASRGQDFLRRMVAMDEGSSHIGELAFGTNPFVKQVTKILYIDEKICNTFHLALGDSAGHTNGQNRSAIHWDLVTNATEARLLDRESGRVLYKDGDFLVP